jgi:hypothetical protein
LANLITLTSGVRKSVPVTSQTITETGYIGRPDRPSCTSSPSIVRFRSCVMVDSSVKIIGQLSLRWSCSWQIDIIAGRRPSSLRRGLMRHQLVPNQVLGKFDVRGNCASPSRPRSRWHFSQCRDSGGKEEWELGRLVTWFSARAIDRMTGVRAWSRGGSASVIWRDVH